MSLQDSRFTFWFEYFALILCIAGIKHLEATVVVNWYIINKTELFPGNLTVWDKMYCGP